MAKVLLVEDDNNLREIYQARLLAEGYDIVAAQNGEEALVVAKQNNPDLIISDVMMPRISGFEMLDILRNTTELKDTKVIMLTALGQAEDQVRAGNLGADRYLVKSQVTLEDIVNAAKELLGETDAPTAAAVAPEAAAQPTQDSPAAAAAAPVEAPAVQPTPSPVADPAPAFTPELSTPTAPVVPEPVANTPTMPEPADDTVVPASVVPQSDVTVVVPPAPANPAAPAVSVTATTPEPVVPAPAASTELTQPLAVTVAPAAAVFDSPQTSVLSPDVSATTAPAAAAPAPADTAAAVAASQPLKTEEASVAAQINEFANQTSPAPAAVEPVPDPDQVSNDAAMANAVEELNTVPGVPSVQPQQHTMLAPQPEEPATTTSDNTPTADTPQAPVPPTPATTVGGTKVIQPLTSQNPGPSLDELLAKEEQNAGAVVTPQQPPVQPSQQANTQAVNPAQAPAQTGTVTPQSAPIAPAPAPNPDDPSNIAL